jgi:hypothetical protein
MSFMDMCKPQGPLEVLTPEEQRVTDYYQRSIEVRSGMLNAIAVLRQQLKNMMMTLEELERQVAVQNNKQYAHQDQPGVDPSRPAPTR